MMRRSDFEESLKDPLTFWLPKSKEEVCCLLDEKVGDMVGFDQRNPHHCYDLFAHTLHTVGEIKNTAPVMLWVAAFFHDIGKTIVAMEKQGRLVFYGHAHKSSEITPIILNEMGYTVEEIKEICFYIRHHDDFISWVLPKEEYVHKNKYFVQINEENLRCHIEKVYKKCSENDFRPNESTWQKLLVLCYADASAQAETVIQNGIMIDTKEHKLKKILALQKCLNN